MNNLAPNPETAIRLTLLPDGVAHENRGSIRSHAATWTELVRGMRDELAIERAVTRKDDLPAIVPARLDVDRVLSLHPDAYPVTNDTVAAGTLAMLDFDGVPQADLDRAVAQLRDGGQAAFLYASPSDPLPDGRRKFRLCVPVARELAPHEMWTVRQALSKALGLECDRATKDARRCFFIGRLPGTTERETWEVEGEPLDVDGLLALRLVPETADGAQASSVHDVPVIWQLDAEHVDAVTPAVVRLLAPGYAQGGRHDKVRAIGGALGRAGLEDDQIAAIVQALPSNQVPERIKQAVLAAQQIRTGAPTPMWGALKRAGFAETTVNALQALVTNPVLAEIEAQRAQQTKAPVPIATAEGEVSRRAIDHDPRVDEIILWLAAPSQVVFQRSGKLVTITREALDSGGVVRPEGAPTIRELVPARLREIIRMSAGSDRASLAVDVLARGEWDHIRPLDAIVSYPVMRRDGTLLICDGYDAATRTLAQMTVDVSVPEEPTRDDAIAALGHLESLVADFPFASDKARSAWLAMLLTLPARPAIDGPTPLGLLEASQRGSGKTLLADVLSTIVTGEPASRRVAPKNREEWDKVLFSILLAGDPLVLFDNVTNMLTSDALDAVLTGTTYAQRVLGVNEDRRVAVRTVFLASTNNARLSTDLVRRSLGCRLEPNEEQPEMRTGFRHADLLGHVRRERAGYLAAALTILRAYVVAGRPEVNARPMGSYQAWCRVVRDALVWAGSEDPAETQDALRETADVERDELRDLLAAWHTAIGDRAVTVRQLLTEATTSLELRDALEGVSPGGTAPTAAGVGNRLRSLRGQIVGGLVLQEWRPITVNGHGHQKTWRVAKR